MDQALGDEVEVAIVVEDSLSSFWLASSKIHFRFPQEPGTRLVDCLFVRKGLAPHSRGVIAQVVAATPQPPISSNLWTSSASLFVFVLVVR